MGDVRARRHAGQRRAAGVAEQVQHADVLAPAIADEVAHPHPVRRLFREKPRVLESRRADVKPQILMLNRPALRQASQKLPLAAALFRAVIMRLRLFPQRRVCLGPNRLRIRPPQNDIPPPFELLPVARIQHLIIFPCIR